MAQKKAPPKSRAALLIDANLLGSPASGEMSILQNLYYKKVEMGV